MQANRKVSDDIRTPFDRPFDKLRMHSGRGFDTRATLRQAQDAAQDADVTQGS